MIAVLLLNLLGSDTTMRQLAQRGANAFSVVSFGQVALIVLLTPVFMAGAIVFVVLLVGGGFFLRSPKSATH